MNQKMDNRFEMAVIFGSGLERVAVRAITPHIYWLTHCLGDLAKDYYQEYFALLPDADRYSGSRIVDYPFSAFLIVDEQTMLIDTCGPRQQTAVLQAIEQVLDGRSLDTIWISHVELPHAGNAMAIKRRYPQAQIVTVAGGENYELHGLQNAATCAPGDQIVLGQHSVEMVDALFVDHGLSQWLYEKSTGFFFTADWGHNLHAPACGECFQFVDEMLAGSYTRDLFVEDVKVNAWYQFPWLAWTDATEIATAVDHLFATYDVRIFAPSHGNIIRQDFPQFIPLLKEGMRRACAMPFSHHL
jgi:flavorubredoxin